MTEEIKLSKFDSEPWGFRLTGGKDFGTIITVIKIVQGSLAETAGMKVGDLLLAINDQPLTNLTHSEAHDVIVHAGNNFVFTIVRGSLVKPPLFLKTDPSTAETENDTNIQLCNNEATEEQENTVEEELVNIITAADYSEHLKLSAPPSPVPVIEVTPPTSVKQEPTLIDEEKKADQETFPMNDEELEDMMLGHAEVIAGKAIGVDFYKMAPKCEVIEKSEVLQAIQEEKVKVAQKTISKFLQQPDRPKVKPKQSEPPPAKPYKPLIIIPRKGEPKPEEQNHQNPESLEEPTEEKQEETIQQEKQEGLQTIQDEQNNQIDQGEQTRSEEQNEESKLDQTEEAPEHPNESSLQDEEEDDILKEMAAINEKLMNLSIEVQDDEASNTHSPEFEKQYRKINEQLVNLLCMPLNMQRYLVQVKKQLDELRRLKNPPPPELEPEVEPELQPDQEQKQNTSEQGSVGVKSPTPASSPQPESGEGQNGKVSPQGEQLEEVTPETDKNIETEPEPPEEPEIGPPKSPRKDIKWQKEPSPRNAPFFPLTPKPRPVILPEDVRQFHDDEMFTDEFIAETLSGNAEVIQGRAIGVNFMKFKKDYDHLKQSDVYKFIQNEDKDRSVFPSRSGKVPSKEDCVESVSIKKE